MLVISLAVTALQIHAALSLRHCVRVESWHVKPDCRDARGSMTSARLIGTYVATYRAVLEITNLSAKQFRSKRDGLKQRPDHHDRGVGVGGVAELFGLDQ
jgi:hypothetical protein